MNRLNVSLASPSGDFQAVLATSGPSYRLKGRLDDPAPHSPSESPEMEPDEPR